MSLWSPPPAPRRRLALPVGTAVFCIAAAGVWWWTRPAAPPPAGRPSLRAARSAPRPATSPTARAESPRKPPAARARPPAEPARNAPALRVTSDVEGAQVFLDRRLVGTAPLTLHDVAPGTHRLNVASEGHELHGETVEVGLGPLEVDVRFKEVRLEESLDVVHKHGLGSCAGRLLATPAGLRYEAAGEHAFVVPLPRLLAFEVDYLRKNLRVKAPGGRAYNFTVEGPSADPLFTFHKKVEGARRRLAGAG